MQQDAIRIEKGYEKEEDTTSCIELRDIFYSNSKKGNVFQVCLNSNGLVLKRDTSIGSHKINLINICDIIGGRCVWIQKSSTLGSVASCGACTQNISEKQKSNSEENEVVYLYIFAYVLKRNLRNTMRRERTVITLRFRSYDNHEYNMKEAEKWCMALKSHRDNHISLSNIPCTKFREKIQNSNETKRLLILLNPKSGSGKSRELFNRHVVTILNEAELSYDLYVTKHSNYAFNFVRQKNVSMWSGIVAIGGDGLFHEILNGLLKRKDWKELVKNVKLGIVPCGSGNGLARSIAHCFQEPYEPKPILGAALSIVGGQSTLMDVVEIEQHNRIVYSFLSIGWGLISDIDIESERLRSLGYQRFTIWTLHRLINLRTYRGRISYLPKNDSGLQSTPQSINKTNLQHSTSCNTLPTAYESKKHSLTKIDNVDFEDAISLETAANQSCRSRCNSLLSSDSKYSTYFSIADSVYHSVAGNSQSHETDIIESEHSEDQHCLRLEELDGNAFPSLKEPLPNSWIVDDGEFVMIHAAYQTHLGSDCFFSPHSKLNDGVIYLVMIRGGIRRPQLLNFLINMSSGTHLPNSNTEFIKVETVTAFRLEPHDNNGILTVDGEQVECSPLQAKIFPGTVNVMVPNKRPHKDC